VKRIVESMKKYLFISIVLGIVLSSCKKETNEPLPAPTVQEEMVANEFQIICYQGIMKKDTINLSLQIQENQEVKGELAYLFNEKDKNKGVVVGQMAGDTLRANYTFMSEGKESSREVVFLRKGKIMMEAYGDVEEKDGKMVFKDPKKLFFDSSTILSEVDCLEAK
jgi:hypothetical protein